MSPVSRNSNYLYLNSNASDATSSNASASPPLSPTTRRRPQPLRINYVGIDPGDIIGKVLKRVRQSSSHPVLTLDFADNTTFQILVDGYDPVHRGIPKDLEMDSCLHDIFTSDQPLDLEILDCALITLSDKAFNRKYSRDPHEEQWDQKHLAMAFKFAEERPQWHCIWATMEEYDEEAGVCLFRSYDDVYLERLQRSSKKRRKNSVAHTGRQ
ncbi:hypothetical protein BDQ12DRAFT_730476 [Crucibulum laeve]|uniref:Uncharacterized protein n=1 Tax=Crucibulum laeve TaxID=68775 RepID=A0A5C3MST4_9AGAR|nr:hypothetical protein BDQ12DRAFT_730476 [Crucibulum laeve]